VREKVFALRGNPIGSLETLELMRMSAEATNQPTGVALARCSTLATMSFAQAPVLHDLSQAVHDLESHDARWATVHALGLAAAAVYQGDLSIVDQTTAGIDPATLGALDRSGLDLVIGFSAYLRGDPVPARSALTSVLSAKHHYRSTTLAESFLALIGADLGLDLTTEPERRLRQSSIVDGNVMGGINADGLLAIRYLLADDTEAAHLALRRAINNAATLGLTGFWPNECYIIVAAGIDEYEDVLAATGGPNVTSANLRARAEQQLRSGNVSGALSFAHESLAISAPGQAHRGALLSMECLMRILTTADRHTEATRLFGACATFRRERSLVPYPCLQRLLDESTSVSRQALGDAEFDNAIADGATLTISAATDYARHLHVANSRITSGWDSLTPMETRVAELVAEGLTNQQVAKELLMGAETVKTHLSRVFDKVRVTNRKQLIVAASRKAAERHR